MRVDWRSATTVVLLAVVAGCATHAASPGNDSEQVKKEQHAAEERERSYDQLTAQLAQLHTGQTTAEQAQALLGPPTSSSGSTWIYEIRRESTGAPEQFLLTFRNGILESMSASGTHYYEPR